MTNHYALLQYACAAVLAFTLTGCASNAVNMTSNSPDQPWTPRGDEEARYWSLASEVQPTPQSGPANFAISADAARSHLEQSAAADTSRVYRLPELIDLAQRTNPATRVAWQQARQAALAVGMVEASYLPVLTASAIGGRQDLTTPLPDLGGKSQNFDTTEKGTAQILALQWLLFDFGQRQALAAAAKHTAIAANVLFNGSHQKLIFEVSQAYYVYGAAIARSGYADTALRNAEVIQAAAEAREAQGLATSVETAQARQALAQAQLRRVQADGEERDSYQNLLAVVGVNAALQIDTTNTTSRPLPATVAAPLDETIELALSQRPDVAASYAAMEASKAGIDAAEAGYLPKVYVGGNVAWGSGDFAATGLPSLGQQGTGTGLFVGVTLPLYDAGMRQAQVSSAQSRAKMAADEFQRVQTAAVTEIVAARNALRTALESHRAASALVEASATTYDAAVAAYRNGVGTIDTATAADTALLDARQLQAEAHAAALIGATNLAFVVGSLTSRDSLL